jgi:hypothetical protein
MRSGPVETLQETRHGASDIPGLRNEELLGAVVRPMFAWPQRFMVVRQACASGAILTERAASPLLSSSGDEEFGGLVARQN